VSNGARRVVVPWVMELEPAEPGGVFVLECAGRLLITTATVPELWNSSHFEWKARR
jgi:hypothetical protein